MFTSLFIDFIATFSLVLVLNPSYTIPKAPSPKTSPLLNPYSPKTTSKLVGLTILEKF